MIFKKSLKRNKAKKGQVIIEYTILVVAAILAIIAVKFWVNLRDNAFELHFKQMVAPAGGLNYGIW